MIYNLPNTGGMSLNIYNSFFQNMDPNEWELFAEDFFIFLGFDIIESPSIGPDGGKDLIVEINNERYVVSCKHFIQSDKAVGVNDEVNILERIIQHKANGFIGFYSTQVSTSLLTRFNELGTNSNYRFKYFDKSSISNVIPDMNFHILQKYGMCNGLNYVLNVDPSDYKPLKCVNCKKDILNPLNINTSIVAIYEYKGELTYLYGCKSCLPRQELVYAEISQVLFHEQLIGWNNIVNDFISDYKVSNDFYKYKDRFSERILQRMYPQNLGKWI